MHEGQMWDPVITQHCPLHKSHIIKFNKKNHSNKEQQSQKAFILSKKQLLVLLLMLKASCNTKPGRESLSHSFYIYFWVWTKFDTLSHQLECRGRKWREDLAVSKSRSGSTSSADEHYT